MKVEDVRRGLSAMTVKELREMVKKYNATVAIQRYTSMKKAELIEEMLKKGVIEKLKSAPELKKAPEKKKPPAPEIEEDEPKKAPSKEEFEKKEFFKRYNFKVGDNIIVPTRDGSVWKITSIEPKWIRINSPRLGVNKKMFYTQANKFKPEQAPYKATQKQVEESRKKEPEEKAPPAKIVIEEDEPKKAPKKKGPSKPSEPIFRLTDQERLAAMSPDERLKALQEILADLEKEKKKLQDKPPPEKEKKKVKELPPPEIKKKLKDLAKVMLDKTVRNQRSALNASTSPAGLRRAIDVFKDNIKRLEKMDEPYNFMVDNLELFKRRLEKARERLRTLLRKK
jgi:hypothetical protein